MRTLVIAALVAGLAGLADAGVAQDVALGARLTGNSITITQHNARGGLVGISRVYLSPDGAYVDENTVGQTNKGTWRATETDLCLTATEPLPPPQFRRENCLAIGASDRWQVASRQGGTLRYDILKGRSTEPMKPVLPNLRYPDLKAR
jgi:hypothetical protein